MSSIEEFYAYLKMHLPLFLAFQCWLRLVFFSSFPGLGQRKARMLWVWKWVFLGFCDLGNILPLMTGLLLKETALGTTWLFHTSVAQNWALCEYVCVCAKADVCLNWRMCMYMCVFVFLWHPFPPRGSFTLGSFSAHNFLHLARWARGGIGHRHSL